VNEVVVNGIRAKVARTMLERMRGLIGTRDLGPGEGMLIEKCNCIHTFFMSFPIDATFLDAQNRVVKVVRGIAPWHPFVWGGFRARKVLETKSPAPLATTLPRTKPSPLHASKL